MSISWERVLPVIISICVIIVIAIARQHSRTVAAITATMPINIVLAIWILSSGETSNPNNLIEFIEGLIIGLIPTFFFLFAVYFAAKAGWSLLPMLAAGYATWGIMLVIVLGIQSLLKR